MKTVSFIQKYNEYRTGQVVEIESGLAKKLEKEGVCIIIEIDKYKKNKEAERNLLS